jgi:hypothetical protein
MKNKKNSKIRKKLSLSKETVAVLNNVKLLKIIGGNASAGPGEPSYTYTQPSGNCH